MKKLLLLSASALVAAGASAAPKQPQVINEANIAHVSPGGRYAACALYGSMKAYDLESGSEKQFNEGEGLAYGMGHPGSSISDNGIFVGTMTGEDGAYLNYATGQWTQLPTPTSGTFGAWAITPDGSMIVGYIGNHEDHIFADEDDNTTAIPAIWYRKADGTYDNPVELPYPEYDFAGRRPQYVMAGAVSADGNIIVGQMIDGYGMQREPMLWIKKDGNWTVSILGEKLLNPNNVKFPVYYTMPEFPQAYYDYMTPEQQEAYTAAYNAWEAGGYLGAEPAYTDFMTPEAKKVYEEKMAEYNKWKAMMSEWDTCYWACLADAPLYEMNDVYFNGTTAVFNSTVVVEKPGPVGPMEDPLEEVPQIIAFNVNTGEHTFYLEGGVHASGISGAGDILCYTGDYDFSAEKQAMIITAGTTVPMEMQQWLGAINAEYPEWMKENMTHEYNQFEETLNPDTGEYEWVETKVEKMVTGEPNSTNTLNLLAFYTPNNWDTEIENLAFCSYLIPLDLKSSIENISESTAAANIDITALRGGIVRLSGEAKSLRVYDLQGRMMFETLSPAAEVATGITSGIYLIKAEAADGSEAIAKAVL